MSGEVAALEAEVKEYKLQLETVQLGLAADPDNQELQSLKSELEELQRLPRNPRPLPSRKSGRKRIIRHIKQATENQKLKRLRSKSPQRSPLLQSTILSPRVGSLAMAHSTRRE